MCAVSNCLFRLRLRLRVRLRIRVRVRIRVRARVIVRVRIFRRTSEKLCSDIACYRNLRTDGAKKEA